MNVLFQCAGITGLIFLFYGLVAFAVTQASSWFFWTLLGVGVSLIFVFIVGALQRPTLLTDLFKNRSLRSSTGTIIYSIVVIGILVVSNVESTRFFHLQKDFTADKVNTLTDQSVKAVTSVNTDIHIIAFFDERNPAKSSTEELLGRYTFASKFVKVQFVDPDKNKLLAQQHNAKDGDILIEHGVQKHITQTATEEGITQAILKVARTTTPVVCFTQGHGELDIDGEEENQRSLSAVKAGLTNEGYQPKNIPSVLDTVPTDCVVVVVAGPTQSFTKPEADSLDRFLGKGGKVFLLVDPTIPNPNLSPSKLTVLDTGLESLAQSWGIVLGRNFLLEKHLELFAGVKIDLSVRAQTYGDHPVVDPLKNKHTVFDRIRSVQKAKDFSGTAVEIIFSAERGMSWAQSNVDALFRGRKVVKSDTDIAGPVSLAVASEKELKDDKKAQLLVIGDSDFASNGMVRSFEFNYDLVLNSLHWLSGTQEQISIRPKQIRTSAIELTPEQSNMIFYIAIVGLPMLVLTFGLNLWWYRRRKG